MKSIVVVIDEETGDECMYIDGKRWSYPRESTVYACDIAFEAGDEPFTFKHYSVEAPEDDWPMTLSELESINEKLNRDLLGKD